MWNLDRLGLVVGAGLAGASLATLVSAHGGDTTKIHACPDKKGVLRMVGPDGLCKKGETALDWNIVGNGQQDPKGDKGEKGDRGDKGDQGLQGPQGLAGPAGSQG